MSIRFTGIRLAAVLASVALVAAACGDDDDVSSQRGGRRRRRRVTLRLGYFPNVTHAPAIIGVETGLFAESLGDGVGLEPTTFNSGTEVVEAVFSGALDASFIGPNPAINGYAKSQGEAVRIVAGTTSGGASLVVREGIDSPDDLAGTTLASPSLGNTQDVALRAWLAEQGLRDRHERRRRGARSRRRTTPTRSPPSSPAPSTGRGCPSRGRPAWSRRAAARVLLDEAELWPDGEFVTTHLIVATEFLDEHPDVVRDLIAGLGEAIDQANDDAAAAQTGRQRRHREGHDEPARRRHDRRGVGAPDVHARPDRLLAAGIRRRRRRRRPARPRRPHRPRHLRPRPPQRGARRPRRSRGVGTLSAISLRHVHKTFGSRRNVVEALRDVDIDVAARRVRLPRSAPRAAASRRSSTSSPGSTRRRPGRSRSPAGRR